MNNKCLFVAEADKIQDILFHSSKLREVAGGSQMLEEFCKEAVPLLVEKYGGRCVISGGGSFRILFNLKDDAEKFGKFLSELYRRELGGTITVAKSVEVDEERNAINKAQENLRKAKHSGKPPVSIEQMPYMAICASCGIGIANYHKKRFEKKNYLCEMCDKKSEARIKEKYLFSWDEIPGNDNLRLIDFLEQKFCIDWVKTAKIGKMDNDKAIRISTEKNFILLKIDYENTKVNIEIDDGRTDEFIVKSENGKINIYEEKFLSKFITHIRNDEFNKLPDDVDEIAELESRNYVAYIVADVNNMGKIFSDCDSFEKLEKLSFALDKVIQESLAEPSKSLIQNQKKVIKRNNKSNPIPVLPLILGGDDVFALIPAQWALDFTLRFSQEFERRMKTSLGEIKINSDMPLTISSAVMICKGNFPYLIAHNIGEELLINAKKRAKKDKVSTISFRIITGNEIIKKPEIENKFMAGFPVYKIDELKKIIDYRQELKELPGTRRAQLESLFQDAEELQNDSVSTEYQKMKKEWNSERELFLKRLEKDQREIVYKSLKELGGNEKDCYWIMDENIYYHKLPDLLLAWDFAYDLEKDLSKYEVEEK